MPLRLPPRSSDGPMVFGLCSLHQMPGDHRASLFAIDKVGIASLRVALTGDDIKPNV